MKILKKFGIPVMSVSGLLFVSLFMPGCNGGDRQPSLPEYAVMELTPTSVTVNNAFPATVRGSQDIEIRSNVSGFIVKVCVDEGDKVKKGQVLFEIDHSIYEASYNNAKANLEVAKANLETAKITAANKNVLYGKGIISEYEKQLADNQLESSKAAVAQAEANLHSAKTNLDYSYVLSPSDGVVGTIPFRIGSLVGPSTATPLTTVSEIDEMFVYFSMNEKAVLNFARKGGGGDLLAGMPEVELKLADGTIYPHKGKVSAISGVLDVNTGAANMRAVFSNPERLLRSGNTGTVLIPEKYDSTLLIPQSATYELQDKKFVCLLNDSNVVKSQEIQVNNLSDGKTYIVTGGLVPGDRIVIEGVGISVKDGMKIKPITKEESDARFNAATANREN